MPNLVKMTCDLNIFLPGVGRVHCSQTKDGSPAYFKLQNSCGLLKRTIFSNILQYYLSHKEIDTYCNTLIGGINIGMYYTQIYSQS